MPRNGTRIKQLGFGCFWKAHRCQSCCTLGRAYGIRTLDRCSHICLDGNDPQSFQAKCKPCLTAVPMAFCPTNASNHTSKFRGLWAYGCLWPCGPLLTMRTPSMTATPYTVTIPKSRKNTKHGPIPFCPHLYPNSVSMNTSLHKSVK